MESEKFNPENTESDPVENPHLPAGVGEIRQEFFRSGGKGGQNVNKVESGVRLRAAIVDPGLSARLRQMYPSSVTKEGEFLIEVTQERTQAQNVRIAYQLLDQKLAKANEVQEERIPTKVPRREREKRIGEKRYRSERLRDREVE